MKHKLLLIFILSSNFLSAQNVLIKKKNDPEFKYYDNNFKLIEDLKEKAFYYFSKTEKLSDTCYYFRVYKQMRGLSTKALFIGDYDRLFKFISFKDSMCTIKHGEFGEYNINGKLTSIGNYTNGKKDGLWVKFDDALNPTTVFQFREDPFFKKGFKNDFFNIEKLDSIDDLNDKEIKLDSSLLKKTKNKITTKLSFKFSNATLYGKKEFLFFSCLFINIPNKNILQRPVLMQSNNYRIDTKILKIIDHIKSNELFNEEEKKLNYYKQIAFKVVYYYNTTRKSTLLDYLLND